MPVDEEIINHPAFWERYFQDGWEKNDGRTQTRLFAKYFLDAMRFPPDARTLLDVGCGMGDAIPEIHRAYPHLQLTGCDISANALAKARASYGEIATFHQWGFDQIEGTYDLMYCSNTLEHFVEHVDIARRLLARCRRLYVLVPYMELRNGRPLTPEPGEFHVATFDKHSFDDLVKTGDAANIRCVVTHTPGAWGTGPVTFVRKLKSWVRRRPVPIEYRQAFFEITNARPPVGCPPVG